MHNANGVQLDHIVFIGRTYFEYMRMFDLDESLLRKGHILDCAAGPSSFTAEAHVMGFTVTACDMAYDTPVEILLKKGRKDIVHTMKKVDEVPNLYVWKYFKNSGEVMLRRYAALQRFTDDYPDGLSKRRYIQAELPRLPFASKSFSLVLSSHCLFLYSDRLNIDFHVASLQEMVRVSCGEVRAYPLQGLDAEPYPHMEEVLFRLRSEGTRAEIVPTPFEFQRGANQMLVLKARE